MILNRIANGIKNQDWFVVLVELLIVVVGFTSACRLMIGTMQGRTVH